MDAVPDVEGAPNVCASSRYFIPCHTVVRRILEAHSLRLSHVSCVSEVNDSGKKPMSCVRASLAVQCGTTFWGSFTNNVASSLRGRSQIEPLELLVGFNTYSEWRGRNGA